jgi:hypothetical protein
MERRARMASAQPCQKGSQSSGSFGCSTPRHLSDERRCWGRGFLDGRSLLRLLYEVLEIFSQSATFNGTWRARLTVSLILLLEGPHARFDLSQCPANESQWAARLPVNAATPVPSRITVTDDGEMRKPSRGLRPPSVVRIEFEGRPAREMRKTSGAAEAQMV